MDRVWGLGSGEAQGDGCRVVVRLDRGGWGDSVRDFLNVVEIDLLCGGELTVDVDGTGYDPLTAGKGEHYVVCVRRAARPMQREVYPIPWFSRTRSSSNAFASGQAREERPGECIFPMDSQKTSSVKSRLLARWKIL